MSLRLLTLPARVGIGAVRLGDDARPARPRENFEAPEQPTGRSPTSEQQTGRSAPPEQPARRPAPPDPAAATEQPVPPRNSDAPAIDDPPELVAEFAEPGAEDGAGAQVEVDEPWTGYSAMGARAVVDRVVQLGPSELAVVELYERTHRNRATVLQAAERRLRAVTRPGGGSSG
jgi:hypothetical protein